MSPAFAEKRESRMRRAIAVFLLLAVAVGTTGCIVEPGRGGGWCYWHPYRCR